MGVLLEKTRIAEDLLSNLSTYWDAIVAVWPSPYSGGHAHGCQHRYRGRRGHNGTDVPAHHASARLPRQPGYRNHMRHGYPSQIIPPSIAVLLGDVLSNGYQRPS